MTKQTTDIDVCIPDISAFLVTAPSSGAGKTTIARELMAHYVAKGKKVQPFKCGPDYIDTKFHERVCGRPSVNLDLFMLGEEHVRELFKRYSADADMAIVEGMMGMYDGYDHDKGSAADIARLLGIPVVIVVDAHSSAYSMAPLLRGFMSYDSRVCVAGVIFNKVGSSRHEATLRQVCEEVGLPCLGCIKRQKELETGSRYLGLDFTEVSHGEDAPLLSSLAEQDASSGVRHTLQGRASVAYDGDAFSFIYTETIDMLRREYADVVFFNPEKAERIPDGTTLLYLPGGYPEKHLPQLAANASLLQSIRDYAEAGGRIEAECGGMMYLCRSIIGDEGEFAMCGVLPYSVSARKEDRKLSLGYRRFVLDGVEYRGHEFHYTQFVGDAPESACKVYDARGNEVCSPVIRQGSVLASYVHRSYYHMKVAEPSSRKERKENKLTPLAFFGTGSDVGKSVIAAGFCRIFMQDGLHPAPFKAQNMALNSYATPDGLEIGRAQAVQAEAAGIPCHTDMNPLLLKPQSDHTSQVVLNGKPIGNQSAYSYFRKEGREHLRKAVCEAFDRLSARYSPIVMEGAGSVSEINLRDSDLVNMPMARYADANVILVADIDRGGVFASVYGSIMLQTPEDRKRIKGIIINKFRGDQRLFDEGRNMIERLCGVPVLGVVPYMTDIHIEEEDSVDLAEKAMKAEQGRVNVAVVMLRHISNFTDFDALEHDARVHLYYTNNTAELEKADVIIVPGSKSTIDDLYELRRNGCAQAIQRAHRNGTMVIGICGGYQMLGMEVLDPMHVEGEQERVPGLNLLPLTTTMSGEKVTKQVEFSLIGQPDIVMRGYEIHMGRTTIAGDDADVAPLTSIGGYRKGNCMGTYIHGIFDNASFIDNILKDFTDKLSADTATFDYQAYKEKQYDLLAEHIRKYVDMEKVYEILGK